MSKLRKWLFQLFLTSKSYKAYYLHHNDDILCLTMHPNKRLVASGETGKSPSICIWDSVALKTVSVLIKEDSHTHGVGAIAFSQCGSRLLSVGVDPNSLVSIWNWESARQLCIVSGHTDRISDCCFLANGDSAFFTVGVKHVKAWNLTRNTLKSKGGIFGKKGDLETVPCCTRRNDDSSATTGTMDGSIYV